MEPPIGSQVDDFYVLSNPRVRVIASLDVQFFDFLLT